MEILTFEELPKAVMQLHDKLNNIERILTLKSETQKSDQWFDLNELCVYLPEKPAKPTVYGWVHSTQIPFHKRSKKLFFLKSEIDIWLKSGRKKTFVEVQAEANTYLHTKGKRG